MKGIPYKKLPASNVGSRNLNLHEIIQRSVLQSHTHTLLNTLITHHTIYLGYDYFNVFVFPADEHLGSFKIFQYITHSNRMSLSQC